VLLNIVGNAIKFTETGSVRLSISVARREGKYINLTFSVTDTGKGIPAELHDRLFEPFEQADRRSGG
jgi:signal transduction histidine kinase